MQNAIWPTTWRQPETTAFRASMQAPDIHDSTFRLMCAHMDQAVAQAQLQGACNGAIIVDPQQGEPSLGASSPLLDRAQPHGHAHAVNALLGQPLHVWHCRMMRQHMQGCRAAGPNRVPAAEPCPRM